MGIIKKISTLAGHIVDVRVDRWFDITDHKERISYLNKLAMRVFKLYPKKNASVTDADFENIVLREALSPEWLEQQCQQYKNLSLLFFGIAILLFAYSVVLLCLKNFMGLCIGVALVIYMLSLAFRFHFLHFQILKRKLACTPQEWFQFVKTHYAQSMRKKT